MQKIINSTQVKHLSTSYKKRLFVFTPIIPSKYAPIEETPVVHIFAKEWVKMGYEVHLFHLSSRFPTLFYWVSKMFNMSLSSKIGSKVATTPPKPYNEVKDGVVINHLTVRKFIPHTTISYNELQKVIDYIEDYSVRVGMPDYIIGHWDLPNLELMPELKKRFNVKSAIVLHSNSFDGYEKAHGADVKSKLESFDAIGFRNATSKANYIKTFGEPLKSFMASSGVNQEFLDAGATLIKSLSPYKMRNFIYVGTFIKRKYPATVLEALNSVYPQGDFRMTYVGEGGERGALEAISTKGQVVFTGRINRNAIIAHLKEADVFVMVSQGELFGLVYLEAMALGCLTIAAKNEGIDGIIIDGYNGFLCEAGNVTELSDTIKHINALSAQERAAISEHAKETAHEYSDANVAQRYIEQLMS